MKNTTIIALLITAVFLAGSIRAQYDGGSGTEGDPYQIATLDHLQLLSETAVHWNKFFVLTADIDASDTQNWNNGKGFSPIGSYDTAFSGGFDGAGHTISSLFIDRPGAVVGFFRSTMGGFIKNLNLDDFHIEADLTVGTLAGVLGRVGSQITTISNVNITNCYVKGASFVGGMTGEIVAGIVENCLVQGTIIATSAGMLGGLAGKTSGTYGSQINNCKATVELFGSAYTGGLVGRNLAPITNCHALVSIENTSGTHGYFGGLIGENMSTLTYCKADGEMTINGDNRDYIGGIAGANSGTINNCYASVEITAPDSECVGGLAGWNKASVHNSYAFGNVAGKNKVGGFTGENTDGSETNNCYASGNVASQNTCGGFVGENSYLAYISNAYAAGEVNGEAWFSGGFAGLNRSTALTINCFFDKQTTNKTIGIGMDHNGQNQDVTGLSTIEFNNQSIFSSAGWSFGNTNQSPWKMATAPDGYQRPVFFYHQYYLSFQGTNGGTLSPENLLTQIIVCGQSSMPVLATADDNYIFTHWQNMAGDSITNTNPLVIENVISDSTLIAVFDIIDMTGEEIARKLIVFPNPTLDFINIDLDAAWINADCIIEIQDINGQSLMMLKPASGHTRLDISKFENGLYFVKIYADTKMIMHKLMIY